MPMGGPTPISLPTAHPHWSPLYMRPPHPEAPTPLTLSHAHPHPLLTEQGSVEKGHGAKTLFLRRSRGPSGGRHQLSGPCDRGETGSQQDHCAYLGCCSQAGLTPEPLLHSRRQQENKASYPGAQWSFEPLTSGRSFPHRLPALLIRSNGSPGLAWHLVWPRSQGTACSEGAEEALAGRPGSWLVQPFVRIPLALRIPLPPPGDALACTEPGGPLN